MRRWTWIWVVFFIAALAALPWLSRRRAASGGRGRPPATYVYNIDKYRKSESADILFYESGSFEINLTEPRGIAAGPGDGLCLVGDDCLLVLDGAGQEIERRTLGGSPNCVAVDGAGNILVGMGDHVAVCAAGQTNFVHWSSFGENAFITSIAPDGTNVFAADFGNRVVWRYDMEGRLRGVLGREGGEGGGRGFVLPSANFDLLTRGDRLWVVNPGRTRVEEYSFDGRMLSHWGRPSMGVEGFCGCCNPSHLAVLHDGRFVTSEKGLPRVKVYDRQGEFVGIVAGPEQFDQDALGLDLAVDRRGRIMVLDPGRRMVRVFVEKG